MLCPDVTHQWSNSYSMAVQWKLVFFPRGKFPTTCGKFPTWEISHMFFDREEREKLKEGKHCSGKSPGPCGKFPTNCGKFPTWEISHRGNFPQPQIQVVSLLDFVKHPFKPPCLSPQIIRPQSKNK